MEECKDSSRFFELSGRFRIFKVFSVIWAGSSARFLFSIKAYSNSVNFFCEKRFDYCSHLRRTEKFLKTWFKEGHKETSFVFFRRTFL